MLADVRPAVLSALLQYLYTGSCLFPRDDLNLAIDVSFIIIMSEIVVPRVVLCMCFS